MELGLNLRDWKKLIEDEAKLRGYSKRTISSYIFHVGKFIGSECVPRQYLLNLINLGKSD